MIPDFNPLGDVTVPTSIQVCHGILPPTQQIAISKAARLAKEGLIVWAERERAQANYDNLHYRPDADRDSGTV